MTVKPQPDGYASVTPYLIIKGAAKAIEFYAKVFAARERMRLPMGDHIAHAEIAIGDSLIMLADEYLPGSNGERGSKSPLTIGGTSVSIHLYIDDVDAVFAKAVSAGATSISPVALQFYGDRTGMFADPFGHIWNVATHVEDVSPDELQKRLAAMSK